MLTDTILKLAFLAIAASLVIPLIGWPLARRARSYANAFELFLISTMCGQSVLFGVQFLVYVAGIPRVWAVWASETILLVSLIVVSKDYLKESYGNRLRPICASLIPLLAWLALTFAVLSSVVLLVVPGIPGTYWDWWEHYSRALIFRNGTPADTAIGAWSLAARGPVFNALAAALMTAFDMPQYWAYCVIVVTLNTTVVLPMSLLLSRSSRAPMPVSLLVTAAVLLFAPYFNWNFTFLWPKMAATTWILTSLVFSLAGVRRDEPRLVGWGIFSMSLALLTHYMAYLYALILLPYWIYYCIARRSFARPLLTASAAALLFASVWFCFLVSQFGVAGTLAANSTLGTYKGWGPDLKVKFPSPPTRLEVMALNTASSLLPTVVRSTPAFEGTPLEASTRQDLSFVRGRGVITETGDHAATGTNDHAAVFRVGQLEGAFGWSGLVLIGASLVLAANRPRGVEGRLAWFWSLFTTFAVILNVWSVPWYSSNGILTLSLQPILCLAVVLVASGLDRLPAAARVGLGAIWFLECGARTTYILHFQARELPFLRKGIAILFLQTPASVDKEYSDNYILKLRNNLVMPRDLMPAGSGFGLPSIAYLLLAVACFLLIFALGRRKAVGTG